LYGEVIQNLISNAIKFSLKSNIVSVYIDNASTLVVKDEGQGIPADMLTKLFNLEEKTSRQGTAGEEGTGFGLPLSYDIIKAHGGELRAYSVEGEGSSFFIQLPDSDTLI